MGLVHRHASERSTLSNTGPLSYTFFRQEPTPLTFTVLCSQCLGPTLTFSLVVSAHSFAKGLAPDHPYLPQIRSCVAALVCVLFPADFCAACIDGDTCEVHAVFPVVIKAEGALPSPKDKPSCIRNLGSAARPEAEFVPCSATCMC